MPVNKVLRYTVEGISCSGCSLDIETVLLNTEGIAHATVSFSEESLSVEYDPDIITEQQILSVLSGIGLRAKKALP